MSYQLNFTDEVNKNPLVIEDQSINEETSLLIPGRNSNGYGQIIAENFLHLLENFANSEAPTNPVQGQLWYDSNASVSQLKVYDGAKWSSAGGLKKGAAEPNSTTESVMVGDLWVNTGTQQLYLFTGSGWILVGPKFSSGSRSGAEPEVIIDTTNTSQTVVTQFVSGERIAIISNVSFTPKSTISGFPIINTGITLNSSYNKYYGVAEKAEALIIGSTLVPGTSFLRSDKTNNTLYPFNVRNSSGISVGEDAQLILSVESNAGALTHKTTGSSLDLRVNAAGDIKTVLRVDSSQRVGINNLSPQESLDVTGNILASGTIKTTDITNSTSSATGALTVAGGVGIDKDLYIGGNLFVAGAINTTGNILPATNLSINLGSSTNQFNRVYASRFDGAFYGNLVGTLQGNAEGYASRLASATTFRIIGDMSCDDVVFDGATGGTTKTFDTSVSETFISSKPVIEKVGELDEILVSQVDQGLRKITKRDMWKQIPMFPVGAVIPYAGAVAPTGWLLCDGSEVKTSDYLELFAVIGYTYGDVNILQGAGSFKLPDMRGRNALGLDNMNNQITIPSKDNPSVFIQPGGGSANRVTDIEADSLGLSAGSEQTLLNVTNLPDHKHNMKDANGNQFYAFKNIAGVPTDTAAVSGNGSVEPDLGQYLPNSGGVQTTEVAAFGAMAGGSGYVNGVYNNVIMTFVSGVEPTTFPVVNVTVTNGAVTNVRLVSGGTGIYSGTILTVPASSLGGSGSGFNIVVESTVSLQQPVKVMNPYLALNYIIYTGV